MYKIFYFFPFLLFNSIDFLLINYYYFFFRENVADQLCICNAYERYLEQHVCIAMDDHVRELKFLLLLNGNFIQLVLQGIFVKWVRKF
jgi:hypothetical protein